MKRMMTPLGAILGTTAFYASPTAFEHGHLTADRRLHSPFNSHNGPLPAPKPDYGVSATVDRAQLRRCNDGYYGAKPGVEGTKSTKFRPVAVVLERLKILVNVTNWPGMPAAT